MACSGRLGAAAGDSGLELRLGLPAYFSKPSGSDAGEEPSDTLLPSISRPPVEAMATKQGFSLYCSFNHAASFMEKISDFYLSYACGRCCVTHQGEASSCSGSGMAAGAVVPAQPDFLEAPAAVIASSPERRGQERGRWRDRAEEGRRVREDQHGRPRSSSHHVKTFQSRSPEGSGGGWSRPGGGGAGDRRRRRRVHAGVRGRGGRQGAGGRRPVGDVRGHRQEAARAQELRPAVVVVAESREQEEGRSSWLLNRAPLGDRIRSHGSACKIPSVATARPFFFSTPICNAARSSFCSLKKP